MLHVGCVNVTVGAAGVLLIVTTCVLAVVPQLLVRLYEMVAVPAATPVTTPPLTVAIVASLVVHVPPVVASANADVELLQKVAVPVIDATTGNVHPTVGVKLAEWISPPAD
jgi:hypothetical protein